MYEELIQRLRETSMDFGEADHVSVMLLEAANAIEELSGLVDHYGGETGIKNLQEYASKYWDLLKNAPRWIPVTERLPELDKPVLIFSYGRICFGRLACEKSETGYPIFAIVDGGLKNGPVLETTAHNEFTKSRITHWMPLPELPKEERA